MKYITAILFAALLCGTVSFIHTSHTKVPPPRINLDGSINLHMRKCPYVPKEGDVIRCEDGTNYAIVCIDGLVNNLDLPELHEMVSLLRRYRNNLNQLTRRIHETGRFYNADLEDLRQSYDRLWDAASSIVTSPAKIQ